MAIDEPTIAAIGSALVAVGVFGSTTALDYAASGLVDWPIALQFIAGGIGGGSIGARLAQRLSAQRLTLTRLLVSGYMLYQSDVMAPTVPGDSGVNSTY